MKVLFFYFPQGVKFSPHCPTLWREVLIKVSLWSALQQEADRIVKIWALLSDDNCFQLRFILFSFLVLSASCYKNERKGMTTNMAKFTTAHKGMTSKLRLFNPLIFSSLCLLDWSSEICLVLRPAETITPLSEAQWLSWEERANVQTDQVTSNSICICITCLVFSFLPFHSL